MTAIFVGLVFIVLGAWGVIHWFQEFIFFLQGMLPISILIGGFVALFAGISSVQSRRREDRSKKN